MLRGGRGFVPNAETVIEVGDEVLLVLDPGLEEAITAQFAPTAERPDELVADRQVDVLLIGGGVASAALREQLRDGGFAGSILLVGREADPPYNRPPISKGYLTGEEDREDALPPGRVVRGARRRAAHAHQRDEARPGGEGRDAVGRRRRRLRARAARHRARTSSACLSPGPTWRASTTCGRCATPTCCATT